MSKAKRLQKIETAVAERVAEAEERVEKDPPSRSAGARSERCKRPRSERGGSSEHSRN